MKARARARRRRASGSTRRPQAHEPVAPCRPRGGASGWRAIGRAAVGVQHERLDERGTLPAPVSRLQLATAIPAAGQPFIVSRTCVLGCPHGCVFGAAHDHGTRRRARARGHCWHRIALSEHRHGHALSARPERLRSAATAGALAGRRARRCQFVLNYEEGGENCVLHGDAGSGAVSVRDRRAPPAYPGAAPQHGSHLRVRLARRRLAPAARVRAARACRSPCSASSMALERSPEVDRRVRRARPRDRLPRLALDPLPERRRGDRARAHAHRASTSSRASTGAAPLGWYTGRDSPNTRRLVVEHGGFSTTADYYGDDLPFWTQVADERRQRWRRISIVPYTLDCQRHALRDAAGLLAPATHFFAYLRDTLRRALRRGRRDDRR